MLYLLLIAGALGVFALYIRYDMYEREPWWMMLIAMTFGGAFMYASFHITSQFIIAWPEIYNQWEHAVAVGLCEEFAKLLVVVLIIIFMRKQFNDPMDGIVYGGMAGLGAGFIESWLYLGDFPRDVTMIEALGPQALRLYMHSLWGATSGFALGMALVTKGFWKHVLVCFFLAATLHFAWDDFVGFRSNQDGTPRIIAAVLMLVSTFVFGALVLIANEKSRRLFDPEAAPRFAPKLAPHLAKLAK